jgi:membrane-associated protease RseP (regulator of RpoE activity)
VEPPDVVRDYEPIHPGTNWRDAFKRALGPVIVVIGAIAKYGFAFAKFASIFIAFGGYALLWGWQFGVGIVALLLTHEMGHYIEARRQGLHPKLPVFVPFLGAYVTFKNENLTPWRHAWIALAGPFVGSIAAAGFWAAGAGLDSPVLRALGYTGFFLNLFNLAPLGFLDGGHIYRCFNYLRRGGAKERATIVGIAYVGLALLLVAAMIGSHVSQHRL